MIDLDVEDLHKIYANGAVALNGVTLHVEAGQTLALVGPSGCGKTTLLRVIAGLEEATHGSVRLGAREVTHVPAHRRDVAMVFQRPALLLGRSVRENLAWSWRLTRRGWLGLGRLTAAQQHDLAEMAGLLGIDGLLDRRAGELSGGQQQRVALGRALLRRAPVCLLDEPLGHLETALRTQLRRDLRLLSRRFPATIVHVTHDPAEALALGEQVAVLQDGQLQQAGTPAEVLQRPVNRFVAAICQSQRRLNFIAGQVDEQHFVAAPWLRVPVPPALLGRLGQTRAITVGVAGRDVKFLRDVGTETTPNRIISMEVVATELASQGTWLTCRRDDVEVTGVCTLENPLGCGSTVMLTLNLDRAFWFDTASGLTLAGPAG